MSSKISNFDPCCRQKFKIGAMLSLKKLKFRCALSSKKHITIHVIVKKLKIQPVLSWKIKFRSVLSQKTQILIHVVVEKFKFRSMLSSKNSNFDPCCRQKIQNSIHVVVETSTMFDTVDIKYPCYRRLRRYLSMLRRYSTLFIHGLTSKFLKTYVEITSNMDK